jgi:hypothetical protein
MTRSRVPGIGLVVMLSVAFLSGYCARRLQEVRATEALAVPASEKPAPPAETGAARPVGAPATGRWTRARTPPAAAADPADLRALPYLAGYQPAGAGSGVTHWDRGRASPGLNYYVSGHAPEALLIDLEGRPLHRWRRSLRSVWPQLADDPANATIDFWRRARVEPDGSLFAIFDGLGVIKLNRHSELLWAVAGGIHHDLDVAADGTIWLLDREGRAAPEIRAEGGVLEDFVTVLEPDGRRRRRISVLVALQRSLFAPLLNDRRDEPDFLHTNTLEILDGRWAHRNPAFRKGNLLISILGVDAVAVLDPDREQVVWALKGMWRRQHQPTLLANGRMLIFDNLGAGAASRVLEFDPLTLELAWSYGGDGSVDFLSRSLGSCQRLANGDTLITESQNGRAFEVDADGRVVWDFHNPARAGERRELVASLFEMVRLPPEFPFRGEPATVNAARPRP